jgi:hypothetical protein
MNQTSVIVIGKGQDILFYSTQESKPFFSKNVDQADYFPNNKCLEINMLFASQLREAKQNHLRTALLTTDI